MADALIERRTRTRPRRRPFLPMPHAVFVRRHDPDVPVRRRSDVEYDPSEIPHMIEPIVAGRADVVYGSRFIGSEPHRVLFFWHRIGNGFLTLMSNMLADLNFTDIETGYKAFRAEIVKSVQLEELGFGFEPEITVKIAKLPTVRIYEAGISYYGRIYVEEKNRWKNGFRALYCIIKYEHRSEREVRIKPPAGYAF